MYNKNNKYKTIALSMLIICGILFLFTLPSLLEYNKLEKRLKENYCVARGTLLYYKLGSVGGHGYFKYEFCVDSTLYTNNVSLKYFDRVTGKVGDTISVAYELGNIENNKAMYQLFISDSIGKRYKYEFK